MHLDKLFLFFTFTIICSALVAESYKFLGILPTKFKSHFIFGSALMKGLAQKGHQVYVISPFLQKEPIKNYHDVAFTYNDADMEDHKEDKDQETDLSELVLKHPNVQKLMKSNHKFDAVICEVFYAEALFGISEHFRSPLIGLSAFGNTPWNIELVGSPSPPSYVPTAMTEFTDHMSFTERVVNLAYYALQQLVLNYYSLPQHAASYKKNFPDLKKDLYTVRNNVAVVLINAHESLDYPRPYVPAQIAVGGMHINHQRQPLPDDIEQFIKDAEHGVIYFSMGTNEESKDILAQKTLEIFKAFRQLKQRVLWQLDDPILESHYTNILIRDWFPQEDILAHENVKVFITQGGALSISESIYHATPFIGIPVVGDQYSNIAKAKSDGIAISLNYETLNAENITAAVEHIINNKSYTQRINEMSALYRDQPMLPLDLAVYWVEHVARHKGAKYLHCAGLDLNFIHYHNIDVMFLLFGGIFSAIFVIIIAFGY